MGETSFAPGALRRIVQHIDTVASGPHRYDAATVTRLEVMRRRAAVRVEAAAAELAASAGTREAPRALRALARAVEAGRVTWEQCVTGRADDVPEVLAWHTATERPADPGDDDDDYMDQSPLRRD